MEAWCGDFQDGGERLVDLAWVLWCADLDLENPDLDLEVRYNLDLEISSNRKKIWIPLPLKSKIHLKICHYLASSPCAHHRNPNSNFFRSAKQKEEDATSLLPPSHISDLLLMNQVWRNKFLISQTSNRSEKRLGGGNPSTW
ncbi:hypothetical protein L1987_13607 [Smallanthus sonchifolius]|uniref:Uncharacterized protein n=1 Tax=Smallanthus sonchifolius TaxID=185202 RepID=A0ACB9JH00_9ASTR|nr:hypothetical protein L1987_13607 [Smallanthus sonchifolius]